MKLSLGIIICKFLNKTLKLLGRGSCFPGKFVLKIFPSILKDVKLPKKTIIVTGSNGKTSTVEMINLIFVNAGYSVAYNSEGSNQLDGIATLILCNCSNDGVFQKDVLLMEADERYVKYVADYFIPKYFVVTNLYRDQMTRNGNPEYVLSEVKKAIRKGTSLLLNADDPTISSLANACSNITYYGINDNAYTKETNDFIYDDAYYCPQCGSKLKYKYHHFGHIGNYYCSKCDFSRKKLNYYVSDIDLASGEIIINNTYKIKLAFNSIYNVYNILACFSLGMVSGIKPLSIVSSLNDYFVKNGRVRNFKLGVQSGMLLISKHENSVSYNQNIEYIISSKRKCCVVIMVDAISRRYFTSDTSWLWDISFEKLNNNCISKIYAIGTYAHDLAERLEYAGISSDRLYVDININRSIDMIKNENEQFIYLLTCFSDEYKFMNKVIATW